MIIDFKNLIQRLDKLEELEQRVIALETENERLRKEIRPTSDWITIKEAAELLGIDVSTVHRYAKSGDLKKYRSPTGSPRLKRSEVVLFYSRKSV